MGEQVKIFFACPECGRSSCRHGPSQGSVGLVMILGMLLVGSLVLFTYL